MVSKNGETVNTGSVYKYIHIPVCTYVYSGSVYRMYICMHVCICALSLFCSINNCNFLLLIYFRMVVVTESQQMALFVVDVCAMVADTAISEPAVARFT